MTNFEGSSRPCPTKKPPKEKTEVYKKENFDKIGSRKGREGI
jgi:hypothetical protein